MSSFPRLNSNFFARISKSVTRGLIILTLIPLYNLAYSQNVGIGTLTPQDPLHLIGKMRISGGKIAFVNTGESVFVGDSAGYHDYFSDNRNVFVGNKAGKANTVGFRNCAVGYAALKSSSLAFGNVAVGTESMLTCLGGSHNTAIGETSLKNGVNASNNTAVGFSALMNTQAHNNTALGYFSGGQATGGSNTFLGAYAGYNATGSSNVLIGTTAGANETGDFKLYIDVSSTSSPLVYGDFNQNKLTINDSLVSKHFQLTDGATDGYILKSNASGRASWVDPGILGNNYWTLNGTNIYRNSFVGIGTTSPTERLHVLGNVRIESGRLDLQNGGLSTLIGTDAGLNDQVNLLNSSTFVGFKSGQSNISGGENTALGAYSFHLNQNGGFNVALGNGAMYANTSGSRNIAVGYAALNANTTGTQNAAVGYNSLLASTGYDNTAIGMESGKNNATGFGNTFLGAFAGLNNNGNGNVFVGKEAGFNESGSNKLYVHNDPSSAPLLLGEFDQHRLTINDTLLTERFYMTEGATDGYVLKSNSSGKASWVNPATLSNNYWTLNGSNVYRNSFVGIGTTTPTEKLHVVGNTKIEDGRLDIDNGGLSTMVGTNAGINDDVNLNTASTFIGYKSGETNTSGSENTAVGSFSFHLNQNGGFNVALGNGAMYANTSGSRNIAVGYAALNANTTGTQNAAVGYNSLLASTGYDNTAIGMESGKNNATGFGNTFLGAFAGLNNNGNGNVFVGKEAGFNETGSNKLYVHNDPSSAPLLLGEFDQHRLTINDTLLTERFYMTEGATDGYVLKSNASGKATWTNPASLFNSVWSISGNDIYKNNTGNVGVGVTSPLDKLHVVGNLRVDGGKIPFYNTGKSVYIGEEAGLNDLLIDNKNLFVGYHAGMANSLAQNNIALGAFALEANVGGWWNIGIGNNALAQNNGGSENISIGHGSLNANTTGFKNIALGIDALKLNTTGTNNYGFGYKTLFENTTGFGNIAIGQEALKNMQTGGENVAIGSFSGSNNNGFGNTFVGAGSGSGNVNGSANVFLGSGAGANETGSNKLYIDNSDISTPLLFGEFDQKRLTINDTLMTERLYMTEGATDGYVLKSNAAGRASWVSPSTLSSSVWSISGNDIYKNNTGNVGIGTNTPSEKLDVVGNIEINGGRLSMVNPNLNIFIGEYVGQAITTGVRNNAIGFSALSNTNTGQNNVVFGTDAMQLNTSGGSNTAIGSFSLKQGTNVNNSVAVGNGAGYNATGNSNIFLGYNAGYNETGSNKLYIDNSDVSSPLLYGEFDKNRLTVNDTLITKRMKINGGNISFFNSGKSVFVGESAGAVDDLSDNKNTFIGYQAGMSNTTAFDNTAIGAEALKANGGGSFNTAIGVKTLATGTDLVGNVAMGYQALSTNNSVSNVAVGFNAGRLATGAENTFIGTAAGENNTGSGNVFIGNAAGINASGSNKLIIENTNAATPLISGDFTNDRVGINTATPTSTLVVGGTFASTMQNNKTLGPDDPDGTAMVWRYTTNGSGNFVDLPPASSCPGRIYILLNQAGNTFGISTFTNLSGGSSTTISSGGSLMLMSDGTGWFQLK